MSRQRRPSPESAASPLWLQRAARKSASTLSDGTTPVSITYIAPRSRFPRVVLTGSFVCAHCSHPTDKAPPVTGKVAVLSFDGKTHQSRDFGLCHDLAPCVAVLCGGRSCTRAHLALDAALIALQDRLQGIPGDPVSFGQQVGTFTCHIHYPVRELRLVSGSCTTALRLVGAHAAAVRFTERWSREYRHGRYVQVPTRTHTWRVFETRDGWTPRITSTGDPPPQLPEGVSR
jgi:hypothetical protein